MRGEISSHSKDFYKTVRARVNEYMTTRNISRFGNASMVLKTIFMFAVYFVPYALLIAGVLEGFWFILLAYIIMGFGMAGIGLCVMHDANHGSYSKNKRVNAILGHVISLLGGHAINWKIQHNVLHHSYTNVDGMDEDIDIGKILRFSPNQELLGFHRLQYIYAWFLYGLMTLMWCTTKDFKGVLKYQKEGLLKGQKTTLGKELTAISILKVVYFAYILVLPMLLIAGPWWYALVGFVVMHWIAGFCLSAIFQPAHVMESSDFLKPSGNKIQEKKKIISDWAIHQLQTTTNFATKSRVFTWLVGGLNHQIEHHLFPNICHVHYWKISKIVKQTAKEFNLPYNVQPTFFKALVEHGKMLKLLGRMKPAM